MGDAAAGRASQMSPLLPYADIREAFAALIASYGFGLVLDSTPAVDGVWMTTREGLLVLQVSGFVLKPVEENAAAVDSVGVSFCLLLDGDVVPLLQEGVQWVDHLPNAREIAISAETFGGHVLGFFHDDEGEGEGEGEEDEEIAATQRS